MAHKTLINGTAYGIDGGKTLVSGTSYKVTNGKVLINGTAYDISFVLPPSALDLWSGANSVISCITYADGYWVVGGTYTSGTTYYARIAYAKELNGPWTTKDLWNGYRNANAVNCITYANSYWVVGGGYYSVSSGSGKARIAYTTSLSSTWTTKNLWSDGGEDVYDSKINCITYANGYWVVGGTKSSGSESKIYYGTIAYATTPSGTWTTKDLWSGSWSNYTASINTICYYNNYFVVGGKKGFNGVYYGTIAYATTPSGTWTTKDLWTGTSSSSTVNLYCLTYANSYWVVGGTRYTSSTYYASIAYATSLSGTWTTKDLFGYSSSGSIIKGIVYGDGYFVASGTYRNGSTYYPRVAYTASPSGTWSTKNLWSGNNNNEANCIAYGNGYFAVGGKRYASSTSSAHLSYADKPANFVTE